MNPPPRKRAAGRPRAAWSVDDRPVGGKSVDAGSADPNPVTPGPVDPGPVPDARRLRDAALAHLARFAATETGLVRALDRRVGRWARLADAAGRASDEVAASVRAAKEAVRSVAKALVVARVLDDAAFAESRARLLSRGGRSRRAIGAHLAGRGVAQELIETAIEDAAGSDLNAAVLQARRRRIGPFGDPDALDDPAAWNKALAALARAGFDRDTAERALRMEPEEAERMVLARHAL